eukprot:11576462-Prorocentrum_lima.AAC.1
MSVEDKRMIFERIRESKEAAKLEWERKWKREHPSVMPRTFNEVDTGAVGVKFPGPTKPSGGEQGDEVLDAVAPPQGEKVIDFHPSPNSLSRAEEGTIPKEAP